MIVIRSLDAGDYDDWIRLWRGYQSFYRVSLSDDVVRSTWSRLLDPSEPMAGALAVADDRRVGLVHTIRHRSCWTVGDYCYLQDLFVDEVARGLGAGRALIQHVYDEAAAAGCSRVYWLTHETNATAMQLYDRIAERSGFLQYRKDMPAPPHRA